MKLQPTNPVNFGIYKGTTIKRYPNNRVTKIVHGEYRGNKIDVYNAYENNQLKNKLYYVTDPIGWLKSKLKYFENNKCVKTINSTRKGYL